MAQLEKNGLLCYFFITKSSGWESGKAGCDSFQINFLKTIVVTLAVIRCSLQWLEYGKAGIVTFKLAQ